MIQRLRVDHCNLAVCPGNFILQRQLEGRVGPGGEMTGKRSRWGAEQVSYWQSYSDMMAALLIIFILIIAITMAIYRQKNTELEDATVKLNTTRQELENSQNDLKNSQSELETATAHAVMTQEELEAAYAQLEEARGDIEDANAQLRETKSELRDIVGIRTDIIGELQEKFNNSSMQVNPQTGSITFSSDVLFKTGSAQLSEESKDILKEAIPTYLGVLMQEEFRDYIAEIIIEGHTDTTGGYELNMNLSHDRAYAVAKYCLQSGNGLDKDQIEALRKVLTVNGRSYMDPIYKEGSDEVDLAASRRVEIKFRLRENEMIEKIEEVLESGSAADEGETIDSEDIAAGENNRENGSAEEGEN